MTRRVVDNNLIVGQIDDLFCHNDFGRRPKYEIVYTSNV